MSVNATKCVTCLEHTSPVGSECLSCARGYYCNGAISALCRLPTACLGASCAEGATGLQCETCLSGFFKSAAGCKPCSASLASGLIIVPAVFASLVVVAYFARHRLKLFASGGDAVVDGKEQRFVGVSKLATATLLGDLWQRLVLLHQLNLVSLPPGFLSLLGAAALPFGLDAAGPGCVIAWSFNARWVATVAAVAVLAALGVVHALAQSPPAVTAYASAVLAAPAAALPGNNHAELSCDACRNKNEASTNCTRCRALHSWTCATCEFRNAAANRFCGNCTAPQPPMQQLSPPQPSPLRLPEENVAVAAAAAARTPSAVHTNAVAFTTRSWLLSGVVQQCAPILLRVCIEAMLGVTRASDGAFVLWSEPTTLLHAPPHSNIFIISVVLAVVICVLAVVPIKQHDAAAVAAGAAAPAPEEARTWWTWASSLLNLVCAFSVAARVTSESAALALLLVVDLVRLALVWLVRSELEREFASGANEVLLFFASSAALLVLQAAALGCASSGGACAGSAGYGVVFIGGCVIYAALLLYGGGPLLLRTTHAAWCPDCHRRDQRDGGAPAPAPEMAFQPNPMLLRR